MDKELLILKIAEGKSTRQISDETGFSQTNVRYWLRKFNLKTVRAESEKKENIYCLCCQKSLKEKQLLFCSMDCSAKHRHIKSMDNWLKGINEKPVQNKTIRKFLSALDGDKCAVCGIEDWNGKPIILEVEHRDGNSEDSSRENVCLICPNCHSQTDTYKGKNKGNGRYKRRQRYKEGKSY